jgi:alcohol dehydrogenase (cytochrome c)
MTSILATDGGLFFAGDASGRVRALEQDTGRVLWDTDLGSAVTGFPIAYAVGGRQYVAVSTGSSLVTGGLRRLAGERDSVPGNRIFVFALPAE